MSYIVSFSRSRGLTCRINWFKTVFTILKTTNPTGLVYVLKKVCTHFTPDIVLTIAGLEAVHIWASTRYSCRWLNSTGSRNEYYILVIYEYQYMSAVECPTSISNVLSSLMWPLSHWRTYYIDWWYLHIINFSISLGHETCRTLKIKIYKVFMITILKKSR